LISIKLKTELRRFGLLMGTVLLGLGLLPLIRGKTPVLYLCMAAALFAVLAALAPVLLWPIHFVWMKFARLLGRINSFLLLSLVFYLVVTPIKFLRLIFSREDRFGFRTGRQSYWIRKEKLEPRESFRRQF